MAKRELSSTLKNLKFMQRATQKVEKPKEEEQQQEETKLQGNFVSPNCVSRKCIVVLEGDPFPETLKGRMSFQNYNPSIDKLKDEAANCHQGEASTSSAFQSGTNFDSTGNRMPEHTGKAEGKRKRKKQEEVSETSHPKKQQKRTSSNKQASPSQNRTTRRQSNPDKLGFNVVLISSSEED